MRVCTKCKVEYPRTSAYFPIEKARVDGLGSWCRKCCRIISHSYQKTKKGRASTTKAKKKYKKTQGGKEKAVSDNMKRLYGINLEQYAELLERQGNCCAICGKPEFGQRLAIDHCHSTGIVRGLLCIHCNLSLGVYENRKNEFEEYLKRGI